MYDGETKQSNINLHSFLIARIVLWTKKVEERNSLNYAAEEGTEVHLYASHVN